MEMQMAHSKFSVGDEVYLLSTSKWATEGDTAWNPVGVLGEIDRVHYLEHTGSYTYDVIWSTGVFNSCYTDECLTHVARFIRVQEDNPMYDKVVRET